ncbi:hypothetical protein GobsT_17130 [Gemmata obscuriglobus]|nr:hypothetical protein GobsT_17130 [Gemmata obscuriglobus]VTS03185.1 Uncharacterized protein OS=Sorangium cellulosum (strain So ce56) GN=sce5710 PE=4 SV=1 [Gemmata obscuriglobus UQM 2246]
MTEAEWWACADPVKLLASARRKKKLLTDRKFRLFAVECTRAVWDLLPSENGHKAAGVAERYADGTATKKELLAAHLAAVRDTAEEKDITNQAEYAANQALFSAINASGDRSNLRYAAECAVECAADDSEAVAERVRQCVTLRDILGNPFRPVAFTPDWRTGTAVSLARGMYESRDFSAMPILADALQDAGCDSDDILSHCQGPGPHVRGCWVVDLVLGKE